MVSVFGRMRPFFQGEGSDSGYFADGALGSEFFTTPAATPGSSPAFGSLHASASSSSTTSSATQQGTQINSDFAVDGSRWTETIITWSFAEFNYANQQGHDFAFMFTEGSAERDLIVQAIQKWDAAADNLTFVQVPDGEDVDIRFGWGENIDDGSGNNALGQTWSFTSGTHTLVSTGDTYNTMSQALIQVDWADDFSDLPNGSASDKPFLNVVMHEIGHALGLDHYDLAPAIMNSAASDLISLTSHETNGVNYLYPGANVGPDLKVTAFSLNTTNWVSGATVTATYTIQNIGNRAVSENANILNYLVVSNDAVLSLAGGDQSAGTDQGSIPALAAGGSYTGTITFTVDASNFSNGLGSYYVALLADGSSGGAGALAETNEGNNWSQAIQVTLALPNHAPVVTAPQANVTASAGQSIALSSLFSASDSDGDALTYLVYDSNTAANSGRFMVNGTAVTAQTIVALTAAEFAQATFVAGTGGVSDDILVQAFDGKAYSGWTTTVKVSVPAPVNHAPIVTAPQANVTANAGQSIAVSSLFSASDSDGDALTYLVYDSNTAANSGRFMVNGTAVAAQTIVALTAAEFAQATFVAGTGGVSDDILVQAFDGKAYSGWTTTVKVSVPAPVNHAPIVTAPQANVTANAGQSIAVSSLFSASDSDGDALTYLVYDSNTAANSGRFMVNGTAVAAQTIVALTAAEFAQATFVAGTGGVSDDILVQAFDGKAYSGWTTTVKVSASAPLNHAPVVTATQASVAPAPGQSLAVSALFSASDSDGDALSYLIYDPNGAANSGHFVVNGTTVPAQTIYALTAAQFAQATFVAGAAGVSDSIYVQAFDGKAYSGWNTNVNVTATAANHAPVVSLAAGANVTKTPGQSVAVSTLFNASDLDGDALSYFVFDSNASANSGHFEINGVSVAAQTITAVSAAQLAQTVFVAGADGVSDGIYLQAFDGKAYSGWNAGVTVKAVAANNAPTVSLPTGTSVAATAGQTLQLSSLFAGHDADGDALSYFVYDASAAANSGHVVIGGNVVAAQTITAMTAAQLAQATFVAGAAGTSDDIFVQAFDGKAYSGWTSGVHIFV